VLEPALGPERALALAPERALVLAPEQVQAAGSTMKEADYLHFHRLHHKR
jgi:hypothetical protein